MKTYQGVRTTDRVLVTVTAPIGVRDLGQTDEGRRHSPTGFDWGYEGSGPAALAHAILADLLGLDVANRMYQGFKSAVVSHFAYDSWETSEATIRAWADRYQAALDMDADRRGAI